MTEYGVLRFTRYSEAHENGGGVEMTVVSSPELIILEPKMIEDLKAGVHIDFAHSDDDCQTICLHDDFGHSLTYQVVGPATTEDGFEGIEATLVT